MPLLVSAGVVGALRFLDPPSSAFMLGYRLFEERRAPALLHRWVDYEQIAWAAKIAVVAAEDQRFKDHVGFDVNEISASLADARHRGRLRGASTLSQQVAKNLFLWPESTWARKGLEAYFTVLLELLWDKRRILEVYLNVAELGPGVYGVEAAAERYFHKRASELDRAEAALLAAVLPSPRRLRVDAPSDYVRERQAWILGQMDRLGGQRYLAEIE